jgi:ketosteroid isomerase-like protein
MTDQSAVQEWLDRYVAAWRANRREPIEELFTEDAVYRFRPYGGDAHAVRGHEAIAKAWLDEQDAPDSWQARYEPFAVEGDRAVAVGTSRYLASDAHPERAFHNAFLLRFAPDGRCAEFTEYYMEEPAPE